MPFTLFIAGPANRNSLVEQYIVADFGCLPDDDAKPVINEKALADCRSGMDLDGRDDARTRSWGGAYSGAS